MHDIDFKSLRARYRIWGPGREQARPVIFLHSGGGSGAQWEKVAAALADDCQAIAPDLGAGETAAWPDPDALTHDLQAELVASVIDAHADGPVDIVHSYGGATAVRLAVNKPHKVRSLVLIEPILNGLLGEAGDPLFGESERVDRAFVAAIDDGRPGAAWELFIDARNGAGTWARLSERRQQQFIASAGQGKASMRGALRIAIGRGAHVANHPSGRCRPRDSRAPGYSGRRAEVSCVISASIGSLRSISKPALRSALST